MDIKPIRSEADYQAALKEIESHLEAHSGTPEGDRLEVMVTLVEAYEAAHFPIPDPNDPAEVLEYYIESRGLSRADLIPGLPLGSQGLLMRAENVTRFSSNCASWSRVRISRSTSVLVVLS